MGRFDEVYQRSMEDPNGFWAEAAEDIAWYKKWDKVLEWFRPTLKVHEEGKYPSLMRTKL